jgi:hypothetical protein
MMSVDLETFGYKFYMMPVERSQPLADLRSALLSEKDED